MDRFNYASLEPQKPADRVEFRISFNSARDRVLFAVLAVVTMISVAAILYILFGERQAANRPQSYDPANGVDQRQFESRPNRTR